MTSISIVESKLPPGFRFHPRDDELVCEYLMKKVTRDHFDSRCPHILEVNLNKCEPWDIPGHVDSCFETAMTCVGGKEWYFYSRLDRKYTTGSRTNRATTSGYWKATGKDRAIVRKGALVGTRKTLVFYRGRAPKGRKMDWVMHEFRVDGILNHSKKQHLLKDEWVLCRVFNKSRDVGPEPEIGGGPSDISPPPWMNPNIVSDPSGTSQYEQMPCFSISAIGPMNSPLAGTDLLQPRTLQNYEHTYGGNTDLGMPLDSCTENALNSGWSHLTRTDSRPRFKDSGNLGKGISSHFVQ